MNDLRVFMKLLVIMMIVSIGAITITTSLLYFNALKNQHEILTHVANRYRRVLMSVVEHYQDHFTTEHIDQVDDDKRYIINHIEKLIERAQALTAIRGDIQLVTATLDKTTIKFIGEGQNKFDIKLGSSLAVPMQLALQGHHGTIRSKDLDNQTVIAAYTNIDSIELGIVAKSVVADINWQFIKSATLAAGPAMALVLLGAWYFTRISSRMVKKIQRDNDRYRKLVVELDRVNKESVENEKRFKAFFDAAFEGIAITNEFIFLDCNKQFATMFGYTTEEIVGMHLKQLVYADDYEIVAAHIKNEFLLPYEHRVINKNGEVVPVEVRGQVTHFKGQKVRITVVHELTERYKSADIAKRLANHKRQMTKMEAIGNFAAGIAHDFNNSLTPIIGNCDLLLLNLPNENSNRENVEKILNAATTAQLLVHRIQTFTRNERGSAVTKAIRVDACIKEAFEFLRSITPTNIDMEMRVEPNIGLISPSDVMVRQILMNSVKNAADAIGDGNGKIFIRVSNQEILVERWGLAPGPYVEIEIQDNGCGMSKAVLERALDPYYTTKKQEGTGLGLAVVQGILKTHNGYIFLQSEEYIGTKVTIYLPSLPDNGTIIDECEIDEPVAHGKNQRILFVDDEKEIVDMAVAVLTSLEYDPIGFVDSRKAFGVFARSPNRFHVLMTDLTMPKMNGLELIKEAKKINPELKVILSSGFGSDGTHQGEPYKHLVDTYLQKPVTRREYAQVLSELFRIKS